MDWPLDYSEEYRSQLRQGPLSKHSRALNGRMTCNGSTSSFINRENSPKPRALRCATTTATNRCPLVV
jgi:hypothetical protein